MEPRPDLKTPTLFELARSLRSEPGHDSIAASLQIALAVELATLPLYLTAYWSVVDTTAKVRRVIRRIWRDEMYHVGHIANLLAGLGVPPKLVEANPKFPGPLPAGIQPGLRVSLTALSTASSYTFMQIERPSFDPLARLMSGPDQISVGDFYGEIMKALSASQPPFVPARQLTSGPVKPVADYKGAQAVLGLIVAEGEGSEASPKQPDEDNAHYYDFAAIHNGAELKQQEDGSWRFNGASLPMPVTYPIGEVPSGGYAAGQVSAEVGKLLEAFDGEWSSLLTSLEKTWAGQTPDLLAFEMAVQSMGSLEAAALGLMKTKKPDGMGNYAPGFRVV